MLWAALPTAAVPLCQAKRHLRNLGMSPATLSRKAQTALQAKSDLAAGPRGSTPSRPCHSALKAGDHSAVSKQRLLRRANVISATDQHKKQRASSRSELSADTWSLCKDCMLGSLRGENKSRIPLFLSRCFPKSSGSGCPPAWRQMQSVMLPMAGV